MKAMRNDKHFKKYFIILPKLFALQSIIVRVNIVVLQNEILSFQNLNDSLLFKIIAL